MSIFKKIGHGIASIGRKTGSGISNTFKKAGKGIVRNIGSLGGGMGGAEIGASIAAFLGPEAIPIGMIIGGLAGKEIGKEGAGVAYSSLEKKRPKTVPQVPQQVSGSFQGFGGKTGMRPSNPSRVAIPDSKYFRQPPPMGGGSRVPGDRPAFNIVGANGGGRQNPIEIAKKQDKQNMFLEQ